jgi:RNA polymerase sigma-70 factor (ECF subfamily)
MARSTNATLAETMTQTVIPAGAFPNTRWTLIVAAGSSDSQESRSALQTLCSGYWYPIYVYLRRRGNDAERAQDLTQGFFLRLLERPNFSVADPDKGRFRAFLLSSLKFFLSNELRDARTQKRGSGIRELPFEIGSGEEMYVREPFHDETPERIFDRRWAHALLDRVVNRLRDEFVAHGKSEHFEKLKGCLLDKSELPYAELAPQLNTTEAALKAAISRLRKRYRELLRAEIAETVSDPADIDGEFRYLAAALSKT